MESKILSDVQTILKNLLKLEIEKLKPEARFVEDLEVDSLDIVEVVMAVEDHFSVEIPDEVAKSWKQVKDVCEFIEKDKQT